MLNRRILRIKAFKVIYGFAENPSLSLEEARVNLKESCEATRDMYLLILSLCKLLAEEDRNRLEALSHKFSATPEEKNPNMKFSLNKISKLLSEDPDFNKILSRRKLSWDNCDVFLRNLYNSIREKDYYKSYLASGKNSISEDALLFIRIFSEELPDNEELSSILEEMSILWVDDLEYAINVVNDSLSSMGKGEVWSLPELFLSDLKPGRRTESDSDFVFKLLEKAYFGYSRYYQMIAGAVPKWDKDRLFTTDVAIIACGLAEAEFFPEIPTKVTLNEYVEISKFYGTPKSRQFVNGLLDSLIKNNLSMSL